MEQDGIPQKVLEDDRRMRIEELGKQMEGHRIR